MTRLLVNSIGLFSFSITALVVGLSLGACTHLNTREDPSSSVTVSVIDTGFDLKHPALRTLTVVDAYNYYRNNPDISPYLPHVKTDGTLSKARTRMLELLKYEPELERWIPLSRDIEMEWQAAAFHGTAVAGLATFDLAPKVALYKVYPIPSGVDPDEWMADSVLDSIERSVKIGARVINLSLGFSYRADAPDVAKHQKLRKKFEDTIRRHKHVLFVSAAGNENQLIDNETVFGYPCGLAIDNIICVGALNKEGALWKPSPTKGTSIAVATGTSMIYAPGEDVYSPSPLKMCVAKESLRALFSNQPIDSKTARELRSACEKNPGFAKGEATSIAAPMVTRQAIEILLRHQDLSAVELKKRLLESSLEKRLEQTSIRYIQPKSPSWSPH